MRKTVSIDVSHLDADAFHQPNPDYIRGLLADANLTQFEAARRLGVSGRTMQDWLSARVEYEISFSAQIVLELLAKAGLTK